MTSARALQQCSVPGCPGFRPCPTHGGSRSSRNHGGVPRRHRGHGADYDALVREFAGQPCALQLDAGCTGVATGADLVIPRSEGGATVRSNARPACAHCQSVQGGRMTAASKGH